MSVRSDPATSKPRGRAALYVAAFGLLLASAVLSAIAGLHRPSLDSWALGLLRITWWVSAAAIVLALLAVLLPGRRS